MSTKMIKCSSCGNDISSDAKACPNCGAKVKKPLYKKWWFWLIIVVLFVGIVGGGSNDTSESEGNMTTSTVEEHIENKEKITDESKTEKITEKESVETMGQKNARKKAESYLRFSAFSRVGLIEQLEFEGFTTEDAEYAVDVIDVDWNEQAAKKAESYLDFSSFSRDGLIDQLEFEGFTYEQAVYGVESVGY